MAGVRVASIGNAAELIDIVHGEHASHGDDPLWFRGCRLSSYSLCPSLYRHPNPAMYGGIPELERSILDRFKQRSVPYLQRAIGDDWEWLFYMQHYGVPTRLLDWSESPLVAAYFAVKDCPIDQQDSASIWMLDPVQWDQTALGGIKLEGSPLYPNEDTKRYYVDPHKLTAQYPLAVYGTHNSGRIVAQQGVFTVFGSSPEPMEKLVEDGTFPDTALLRIDISIDAIPTVVRDLRALAFTESVVYPDLEGLATEFKRAFGFGA